MKNDDEEVSIFFWEVKKFTSSGTVCISTHVVKKRTAKNSQNPSVKVYDKIVNDLKN